MACTIDAPTPKKIQVVLYLQMDVEREKRSTMANTEMAIPRDPMELSETKNTQVVMHGQDCRSYKAGKYVCAGRGHGVRGGAAYAFMGVWLYGAGGNG